MKNRIKNAFNVEQKTFCTANQINKDVVEIFLFFLKY